MTRVRIIMRESEVGNQVWSTESADQQQLSHFCFARHLLYALLSLPSPTFRDPAGQMSPYHSQRRASISIGQARSLTSMSSTHFTNWQLRAHQGGTFWPSPHTDGRFARSLQKLFQSRHCCVKPNSKLPARNRDDKTTASKISPIRM